MTSPAPKNDRIQVVRTPGRYAVLLNALAKGWTGALHHDIQRLVPAKDLFLTDDFHQAERTIDKLLSRDYDAIFTGGGDGTIVYLVNAIEQRIEAGELDREEAPPVGVLRMGTGNAIAEYVGAGQVTEDLRALRAGAPLVVHSVNMIEGAEGLYPFAGVGWDADILNDYDGFKQAVRDTALENYATGLGGYFASVFTRTIPKALKRKPAELTIINTGPQAMRVDTRGHTVEEFEEGDEIFRGHVQVCATASIPYWGFKIRMFPYANLKPGFASLRCYWGGIPYILTHFPSFWKGEFREEDCQDYLYQSVRVEIGGRPMSYQVAGDPAGYERQLDWTVCPEPIRLAVPLR